MEPKLKDMYNKEFINGTKKHSFANLTTRRHYHGEHVIALLVNGQEKAHTILKLVDN